MVVLYNMSLAGVRVLEFGPKTKSYCLTLLANLAYCSSSILYVFKFDGFCGRFSVTRQHMNARKI